MVELAEVVSEGHWEASQEVLEALEASLADWEELQAAFYLALRD